MIQKNPPRIPTADGVKIQLYYEEKIANTATSIKEHL